VTPDIANDRWDIGRNVANRTAAVAVLGFTERQARFLVTVMEHAGVFVERQYCAFAGIAHGQKTHDFIKKLLLHEFAREIRPGALHRGRLYHVHAKRLYAAIGQTDNRNRRPAPRGRLVERLMLLDAVLDDREYLWLGIESDKWRYVVLRCREDRLEKKELPHLVFGKGAAQTVRLFPDKLPIGVVPEGDRHVFVYLARRRSPIDLRAFLVRHAMLLKALHHWTVRVLVPKPFEKALPLYKRAVFEELARPLPASEADELGWFFRERARARETAAWVPDGRFAEARRRFNAPRFRMLHRLWQQYGENVLWDAKSTILADQLERGWGRVEFVLLSRQYLHLSPLVGVA
jgi:hypothetical protein